MRVVARVRTCYFGFEAFGLAPMFTQAGNLGDIEIVEESEASLSFGLRWDREFGSFNESVKPSSFSQPIPFLGIPFVER